VEVLIVIAVILILASVVSGLHFHLFSSVSVYASCGKKENSLRDTSKNEPAFSVAVFRENGHKVPAIETLEKWARALDVSLYQLFYFGEESPSLPQPAKTRSNVWGSTGKDARLLAQFCRPWRSL
jgi:hypothetical protein